MVDLPMPGAPPSSTSDPGTKPPPSTRSSSPMPVPSRSTAGASTSASGTGRSAFARPAERPGARRAGRLARLLDQGLPLPAAGAAPVPLGRLVAAGGADEGGSGGPSRKAKVAGGRLRPGRPPAGGSGTVACPAGQAARHGRVPRCRRRDERARGDLCELTEVGAVLVGGGELHDRWESLVRVERPLSRGHPALHGHHAADGGRRRRPPSPAHARRAARGPRPRRAQRQFRLARAAPGLRALRARVARPAGALHRPSAGASLRSPAASGSRGSPITSASRSTRPTARCPTRSPARGSSARCSRSCAPTRSVAEAMELMRPRRRARIAPRRSPREDRPDLSRLPDDPGVYVFRDERGRPLYVGKSVSLRSRARAHFCAPAGWTERAEIVDYRPTNSELGALVLENRLIKQWRPTGNRSLKRTDRYVYLRCRLDIPYPILEVDPEPAAGHAVNVGPLRGRKAAQELADQLNSLFRLRHCGRKLQLRENPSIYGQMGRCAHPAWATSTRTPTGASWTRRSASSTAPATPPTACSDGSTSRSARPRRPAATSGAAAAAPPRAPRADPRPARGHAARRARPSRASCSPRHPVKDRFDAFWIVQGRVADWGPLPASRSCASARRPRSRSCARARPRCGRRRSTRCGSSPPGWPSTSPPSSRWPPPAPERLLSFVERARPAATASAAAA